MQIVQMKVPGLSEEMAQQIVTFVQGLRKQDLYKVPGVAETLDWAQTLLALKLNALDEAVIKDTLGVLLKYQDDVVKVSNQYSADSKQ
jgi:MoxR-like ATPase